MTTTFVHAKTIEIISQYQTNNPYIIAEHSKIQIIEHPLSGRLKELYFGDYIIINNLLAFIDKRRYLAHALGHHFLHTGNQLFFAQQRHNQNIKEEAQAEEFAAYLLVPEKTLQDNLHLPLEELSEYFEVPDQFMQYRLQLTQNHLS